MTGVQTSDEWWDRPKLGIIFDLTVALLEMLRRPITPLVVGLDIIYFLYKDIYSYYKILLILLEL